MADLVGPDQLAGGGRRLAARYRTWSSSEVAPLIPLRVARHPLIQHACHFYVSSTVTQMDIGRMGGAAFSALPLDSGGRFQLVFEYLSAVNALRNTLELLLARIRR